MLSLSQRDREEIEVASRTRENALKKVSQISKDLLFVGQETSLGTKVKASSQR
jgi:hypothetical protein